VSLARRLRAGAAVLGLALLLAVVGLVSAGAARSLATAATAAVPAGPAPVRGVSDARLLLSPDPAVRRAAMRRAAASGARVVRLAVKWRALVDPAPPADFDAEDPADPSYDFGLIDGAVRDAVAEGLDPLLSVVAAPAWAEAPDRWEFATPGTWAPQPAAFGRFATALARRYDGTFAGLPRVRRFQAWNEPNLPRYLSPQWVARDGRWVPYAPGRYRELLAAFTAAVHAVHADNVVATAGTAPIGEPRDGQGRMTPVRFWAALLCVTPDLPHRRLPCASPVPAFDAAAHHPLSVGDPDRPAAQAHDVAIADLGKLTALLRAARLPRTPRLWITELNWDAGRAGVPAGRQARYVARGLERLALAGAELVVWQFLADPPRTGPRAHPAGLWADAAGLRPRRFLAAFAFPATARRVSERSVEVWVLPPADARRVVVERRRDGRWVVVRRATVRPGAPVRVRVRAAGAARLRVRAGARVSPSAAVGR
jgi:hypothetical protein